MRPGRRAVGFCGAILTIWCVVSPSPTLTQATVSSVSGTVIDQDGRAVVLTVLSGENAGAKVLVLPDGTTVGNGPAELVALASDALRRDEHGAHLFH